MKMAEIPFPSNQAYIYTENYQIPYLSYPFDVVRVLDSVKILFSKFFSDVNNRPLKIINKNPLGDYPMMVRDINVIYLDVPSLDENGKPLCDWSKFIFQFSHELCHYMVVDEVTQTMRWFEETLCALASHFFLIKSAEQWAINPPYPHWRTFAPSILSYEIIRQDEQEAFDLSLLGDDHSDLLHMMEENEYLRKYHEYIAVELLPLFIENKDYWKVVPYLSLLPAGVHFSTAIHMLADISGVNLDKVSAKFNL